MLTTIVLLCFELESMYQSLMQLGARMIKMYFNNIQTLQLQGHEQASVSKCI